SRVNPLWRKVCDRAGVPLKVHGLRHMAASLSFAQGARIEEVQEMLRHARSSTTRDIYVHVLKSVHTGTAARMDEIFRNAIGECGSPRMNCVRCWYPTRATTTMRVCLADERYELELCRKHADMLRLEMTTWTRVGTPCLEAHNGHPRYSPGETLRRRERVPVS